MRVKAAIIGAAVSALAFGAAAQAAVVLQIDSNPSPGAGLESYTVRLVADSAADAVSAVEATFAGDLNQVGAFDGALSTPTLTNVDHLTSTQAAQDSHFLFRGSEILPAEEPVETSTSLTGAFGIQPAFVAQNMELAQIVVQAGGTVTFTGAAVNGTGQTVFEAEGVVIPEPATMGLLAPLGLGLLARRRRVA